MSRQRVWLPLVQIVLVALMASATVIVTWSLWKGRQASDEPAPVVTAEPSKATTPATPGAQVTPNTVAPKATAHVLDLRARLSNAFRLVNDTANTYLALEVRGADIDTATSSVPAHLVLVMDQSGSMASNQRLEHAKLAARALVDQLQDGDYVSLVTYSAQARVRFPSRRLDPQGRAELLAQIQSLRPDSDTCVSCGLREATAQVQAVQREMGAGAFAQRVVLLSDGRPTSGVTDTEQLARMTGTLERQGATVTTVGVGLDYGEGLMVAMAVRGNGNHYFVENAETLVSTLQDELTSLRRVVARKAVAVITLTPGTRFVRGFDRVFQQQGQVIRVPLGDIPAGALRTVLMELAPSNGQAGQTVSVADARVEFFDLTRETNDAVQTTASLQMTDDAKQVAAHIDPDVAARVEELKIAETLKLAHQEIDRGNYGKARDLVQKQYSTSSGNNAVWGNERLGNSLSGLEDLNKDLAQPQKLESEKERRRFKKKAAKKSRMMSF